MPDAGVLSIRAAQQVIRSVDSRREADSSPRWQYSRYARAIAAGVALTLVAVLLTYSLSRGHRYVTEIGATQTVTLRDGSQVTLNTDTSLRVELTNAERRIQLSKGEAFFSVAPNKQRPFVVVIDGKRVTAVGTQFSVRMLENEIMVVVAEGIVRVELQDHRDATLGAGDVARSAVAGINVTRGQDAADLLSWREGWIRFDNIALPDAVAELNRYTPRQIRIRDSSLDNLHLSGKFRTNNIESFLELLEKGFSVSVEQRDEDVVLKKR
jgi:transmembrane sensor